MLEEQGIPAAKRLKISEACPLIMPYHVALDQARVHLTVSMPDQLVVPLDDRDGIALMDQTLGQIIADTAQPKYQDFL